MSSPPTLAEHSGSPTVLALLSRCGLFTALDRAALARVAEAARRHRAAREDVLWHVGAPALSVLIVESGLVKVVRPTRNGRLALCGLFGPADTVGELPALEGAPYPASAVVASERALLVSVPRTAILEAIERQPAFGLALVSSFHAKVRVLHSKIEVLSAGPVEARLATLMLHLGERFGEARPDGTLRIPIALSRQELADTVSTSFETVVRIMSRWGREGVVLTSEAGFAIGDRARLEAALDGAAL